MNDLPKDWILTTIESIAKIVSGKTPKNVAQFKNNSGSLPWIKVSDMTLPGNEEYVSKSLISFDELECETLGLPIIPAGSVIFPKNGGAIATGKKRKTAINCSIDLNTMAVIPMHMNSDFLFYWFQTIDLSQFSDGSVVPQINKSDIGPLNFPLPPLGEQGRIVEKLDELLGRSRRAREELQHIPKLIQRYKQAVLAAAFRGDLTADWRKDNFYEWSNQDAMIFRQDSLLRRKVLRGSRLAIGQLVSEEEILNFLPRAWLYGRLIDITNIKTGFAFKSKDFQKMGVKLLRGINISPNKIDWTDAVCLQPELASSYEEYQIEVGDLLLAMDRPVISSGLKFAQATADDLPSLLVQRVARIRSTKWTIMSFLKYLLNSHIFVNHAMAHATGSDLPHISSNDIALTPVPIPPLEEQKEIVRRIEERFKAIEAIEQNYQKAIQLLDRLDQATLAKAFRGQLVPQDPNDEPASVLLERIRAQRASQPPARKRKPKTS